ncbi:hypothetical protein IJ182_07565 [bacterium]|nr:hypothetical protein [bacterium]
MKNIIAYVHSHWDREWYREFEEFRLRLIEVFDEILSALENGELPYFYFDGQTAALEDYLEIHNEKLPLIKKLIKEKKLRIGPFYCSADSFLVSGECLYRNFEIGIKKSKELGENEFIAYLSDTFGHSKYIPAILKSLNIENACIWRGAGSLNADLDWEGIKTTYLIQGYFQDFLNTDWTIEKKADFLKKYIDKIANKSGEYILLPIGADHLAIPKNIKKQINELNKIYSQYKITIGTPFDYFKKIKQRTNIAGEFLNNNLNFILPGVYSSRIYIKQANAKSQWLLTRIAEPLQSIGSYLYGLKNRQNEIDYAYKTLIKNHAHDSIYGCSTDKVHDETMIRYTKVDSVSNGIIKRTLRDLSDNNGTPAIINLSNFKYNGKIFIETENQLPKWMNATKVSTKKSFTDKKLYNINDIPITEDITSIYTYLVDVKNLQPFSLTKLTPKYICDENNIKITKSSIENKNIKIEIKNNFINIFDLKNNKEYKNFITVTDRADIGDSYNFGALKNDKPIKAKIISHKIKEHNNKRAVLNTVYEINIPKTSTSKGRSKDINKCKLNINLILYNQSEMVELEINWNNKCKNHILQIGFNLEEKIFKTLSEDLFGTVERDFNPDYDIYKEIPAARGKELKPNTAPMQRFVCAEDVALFTKGNCEYEINKNTLYLTLLRATGIISNPKNTTRGTPAGPPIETPKLQCLGNNSANIAIAFTGKEQELYRLAEEFYMPYLFLFTNKENKKYINTDKNELIYAIKSNDNKAIIRSYNKTKKEITVSEL